MKSDILLLSLYPLARDYLQNIREQLGQDFAKLTISEISHYKKSRLFWTWFNVKPKTLLLAIDNDNGNLGLPILRLFACFSRATHIALVQPKQKSQAVSRLAIFGDVFRLCWASVACFYAAAIAWGKLKILLGKPRIAPCLPVQQGHVLYLKTNLWFGIKAGGSVGHTAGVINALQNNDYPVTVLSAEEPVMLDPDVAFHQVSPATTFGIPYDLNNYRHQQMFVTQSQQTLANYNFAFIYQRLSVANYLGVVFSRAFLTPLIVEYNGSEVWIARNWGRTIRAEKLASMAEAVLLRHAHIVVTISKVLRNELIAKGVSPERVVYYPNCIDPKIFAPKLFPAPKRAALRSRYGIQETALVVAFIGTFGKWHGSDILAEAIAYLHTNEKKWLARHNIHFMLVGDGLYIPQVKAIIAQAKAESCCTMTGLVPQDQAPLHMAAADILVAPNVPNADGTSFFGSPTKLFEYMAMEKAIIASRLEQIGEVLSPALSADALPTSPPSQNDKHLAVLTQAGDREQLLSSIKFLAEQADWRKHLGAQARVEALCKYTWQNHIAAVLARLQNI